MGIVHFLDCKLLNEVDWGGKLEEELRLGERLHTKTLEDSDDGIHMGLFDECRIL